MVDAQVFSGCRSGDVVSAIIRQLGPEFLVECRKTDTDHFIIANIPVDRPNRPVFDIKRSERVVFRIPIDNTVMPEALALRVDFPLVPHRNLTDDDRPVSLCLFDLPWDEVKIHWSGAQFLSRVQWWLRGTSRGDLHASDQLLEPLTFSHGCDLVLPSTVGSSGKQEEYFARVVLTGTEKSRVFVARATRSSDVDGKETLILYIETPIRMHGVIQRSPKSFSELCDLVSTDDFDLLSHVREYFKSIPDKYSARDGRKEIVFCLVLGLPKSRVADGDVEWVEMKAFLCVDKNLEDWGKSLGVWDIHNGEIARILQVDETCIGIDLQLIVSNVFEQLSPDRAALFSGVGASNDIAIVGIGAGALGSQVMMNLARSAFGRWTVIDYDDFMPHNAVRHALYAEWSIGYKKSDVLTSQMNQIVDSVKIATPLSDNVLHPVHLKEEIESAFNESEVIVDMSASLPVGRWLAGRESSTRVMSLFLSPSGSDLILLAENQDRSRRLDELEMCYYLAVATSPDLEGHLSLPPGMARYGGSCRDLSVQISQSTVGTLAGIGSAAIRGAVTSSAAAIQVWRHDLVSLTVTTVSIEAEPFVEFVVDGWRVKIRKRLANDMQTLRSKHLPDETGGILIGSVDRFHKCVFVVMALESPLDSVQKPHRFIRGVDGVSEECAQIVEATAGQLNYVGEWHSHPSGASTKPSADDVNLFDWIKKMGEEEGRPPVMAICGDNGTQVYISSLSSQETEVICHQ